jgi:hypothetical protein
MGCMLTDGFSNPSSLTSSSLIDGFAHKASLAAINGFALWADPHYAHQNRAGGTEPAIQETVATTSSTAHSSAIAIRSHAIADGAAAAGLLLLLVILWRSLRSISNGFALPTSSSGKELS